MGRADRCGLGVLDPEGGAEQVGVDPTEGRAPSSQPLGDVGSPRPLAEGRGREVEVVEEAEEPRVPCPHQPRGVRPMPTRAARKAAATSVV